MPNKIQYLVEGEGDVILFLHGWGQNKEMMYPLIEELKDKYKCVILDMPGFGESNFNNSNNIEEYTERIREFLKENNLLPKYIVGHSFGGKVGVEYYLKYKDIDKMVVIASPILKPTRTIKYYYKVYKHKIMKKFNKRSKGSRDYDACPLIMKNFFVSVVNTHYNKKVKDITIPVLLLWGEDDKEVKISKAFKLRQLIENSKLYLTKGDHFAYLQNIEFTKLTIQKFLRR